MTVLPDADNHVVPLLPSLGRQAVTCKYRCGDACSHEAPNTSGNEYFGDVVNRVVSRRGMFRAGAVVAAAVSIPVPLTGSAAAASTSVRGPGEGGAGRALGFAPVAPNTLDAVVVPPGYEHAVVIRWGDPITPGAPEFDFAHQTPQAQAGQFGYNCDFVALLPFRQTRSLLGSTTSTPSSRRCSSATTRRTQLANRWRRLGRRTA